MLGTGGDSLDRRGQVGDRWGTTLSRVVKEDPSREVTLVMKKKGSSMKDKLSQGLDMRSRRPVWHKSSLQECQEGKEGSIKHLSKSHMSTIWGSCSRFD